MSKVSENTFLLTLEINITFGNSLFSYSLFKVQYKSFEVKNFNVTADLHIILKE